VTADADADADADTSVINLLMRNEQNHPKMVTVVNLSRNFISVAG